MEMGHGIAIAGANGSGKTTLGRYLARLLGYKHMDAEDYYFKASAVPYTNSRTKAEATALLSEDIRKNGPFVLSSVNCDFGTGINAMYDCVIYIRAPLEVRLSRVKERSVRKFGGRVLEGGDMYGQEQKFYEFVASRTMEETDTWLKSVKCPVINLDGTKPVEENAMSVLRRLETMRAL